MTYKICPSKYKWGLLSPDIFLTILFYVIMFMSLINFFIFRILMLAGSGTGQSWISTDPQREAGLS